MEYNVGDKVKITNEGQSYCTYKDMFTTMGFKNKSLNSCDYESTGEICIIFAKEPHMYSSQGLTYGIRSCLRGKEFLMHGSGIELVNENDYSLTF